MKQSLKMEIRRVIHSPWLYISLGISFFIAIIQVFQLYGPTYLDYYSYPKSVFNNWLGGEPVSFASRYIKIIFPVLVALPFSHTLYTDKKSGYIRNICTRVNKKTYIFSKNVVVFFVGFFVGLFPYLLNLLIVMSLYPMLLPQKTAGTFMGEPASFMGYIRFSNPMIYILLYLLIYSVYCGLMATTSLSVGAFAKNRFIVTFTPVVTFFLFGNIMQALRLVQLNPITAFDPSQPARTNGLSLFVLCMIPLLFTLIVMAREAKNETY